MKDTLVYLDYFFNNLFLYQYFYPHDIAHNIVLLVVGIILYFIFKTEIMILF